jgi:hypothetical protein
LGFSPFKQKYKIIEIGFSQNVSAKAIFNPIIVSLQLKLEAIQKQEAIQKLKAIELPKYL